MIHNAHAFTEECKVKTVPHRTVGRITLYWHILKDLEQEQTHVYSHFLASKARLTAAQVRRDLMVLGYSGTPARGYDVRKLLDHIETFLFPSTEQKIAVAGVGNIGRALLKFFAGRRPMLRIAASFEVNPEKYDRVALGCPCYSIDKAGVVIKELGITVGIIAVPDKEAQFVANQFVAAGIKGIINFARTPLLTPPDVYVEDIDLARSMDKVAYFARQSLKSDSMMISKESHR
jgi:redox-sensing transcriptional repressor